MSDPLTHLVHRAALVAALLMVVGSLATCGRSGPSATPQADDDRPVGPSFRQPTEPDVRVRLSKAVDAAAFTDFDRLAVRPLGQRDATVVPGPTSFVHDGTQWRVDGVIRPELGGNALELSGGGLRPLQYQGRWYPPNLTLVPRRDLPRTALGRLPFDVVVRVPLEQYLAGVLEGELYPHWHEQAYRAQAIAARSYALHRMQQVSAGQWFDLEATQVSQVYVGWSGRPVAKRAVDKTRGLVLTHEDRILPAFFHSTCGGAAASPRDAWGGDAENWPPLQATGRVTWCREAPMHNWGPIRRDRKALRDRFVAWGNANRHPIRNLSTLTKIEIRQRNDQGRPSVFRIHENPQRSYELSAETFRAACNYRDDQLKLDSKLRLPSAMVSIDTADDSFIFSGHGFGHGVGLCQYGTQAMADKDIPDLAILRVYYPGAKVQRAY